MGVSINLHVYQRDRLVADILKFVKDEGGIREGALIPHDFLEKVGPEFGILTDKQFLVVWNEYYEDYNPCSNFLQAVDQYYFPGRDEDATPPEEYTKATGREYYNTFWSSAYDTESEGANASEILGELFPDEFGYEGKFSDYV